MLTLLKNQQCDSHTVMIQSFLKYAKLLAQRNFICNTFGNIALKQDHPQFETAVIYTKHRGISLEEIDETNIVVMDMETDQLLCGSVLPSIGHQMNREIFKWRPDIKAVIHLHPDEVLSYYAILHSEGYSYISNDTALVMQKPIKILPPDINIEIDLSSIKDFILDTNCIIMPQHGITVLGESLSEAYHRACSIVAETRRLLFARILSQQTGIAMPYVSENEINHMYKIGREAIYGKSEL